MTDVPYEDLQPEDALTESPPDDGLPPEVSAAIRRLDEIVKRFEEHPDPIVKDLVLEMLHNVDTMHRVGLKRINELLKVAGLQQRAVDDPEVRLLFDLYDLGEGGARSRAEAVVESLRASLESVGAAIELLEADAHTVRVRLFQPAGNPTHENVREIRAAVEQVLRNGLSDVLNIELVEAPRPQQLPANFTPVSALVMPRPPRWEPALPLTDVPAGCLRALELRDSRILLAHLGAGEVYAFRNECPGTPFPLDAAQLKDGILFCPWHGCLFELRGGRRIDTHAPGLGVLPVRVQDGEILVALPRPAAA
jgi:nitrite reductase/ring-hydroxylating ferredoxin subunit